MKGTLKNMEKTIKEIADEIGVSKQKVAYHVKKLDEKQYTRKDKTIYINADGENAIKKRLKVNNNNKKSTSSSDYNVDKEYINTLKKQIEIKDEQIKETQKLLSQQQELQLQANQRIKSLEELQSLESPKTTTSNLAHDDFELLKKAKEQLKKDLDKANDEIEQHQAKLAEKEKQLEEDEKINKEWSESNEELEKENERLKMELEKVQSKKWFKFWK